MAVSFREGNCHCWCLKSCTLNLKVWKAWAPLADRSKWSGLGLLYAAENTWVIMGNYGNWNNSYKWSDMSPYLITDFWAHLVNKHDVVGCQIFRTCQSNPTSHHRNRPNSILVIWSGVTAVSWRAKAKEKSFEKKTVVLDYLDVPWCPVGS